MAFLNANIIEQKLNDNLLAGRVIFPTQTNPFISSPLGLVPKPNGELRQIYHFSFPRKSSVNDYIPKEVANLKYATLKNILARICWAGQSATIIKKDIKDAFRNILVASHQEWLFGFQWETKFYQETCLFFGLSTSPYIFNLFGKGFH